MNFIETLIVIVWVWSILQTGAMTGYMLQKRRDKRETQPISRGHKIGLAVSLISCIIFTVCVIVIATAEAA